MRRAEREGHTVMGRNSRWSYALSSSSLAVWGLIMVLGFIAVGIRLVVESFVAGPSVELLEWIRSAGPVFLIVAIGATVWTWLRRARQARWRQGLDALAAGLQGMPPEGAQGATRWLNAYWPSAYPTAQLWGGPYASVIVAHQLGYPVLIFANPKVLGKGLTPHAEILVAANLHALSDVPGPHPSPHFEQLRCALRAQGFSVEASNAGLRATADAALAEQMLADPDWLSLFLGIGESLTGLLRTLRAVPSTPLP